MNIALESTQTKNTFLFSLPALFPVYKVGLTQPQTIHCPAYKSKLECLALEVTLRMLIASHSTQSLSVFACLTSYISKPVELAAASSPSKVEALPNSPSCLSLKWVSQLLCIISDLTCPTGFFSRLIRGEDNNF